MAKTSLKVKQAEKTEIFDTRHIPDAGLCGRPHSVLRKVWNMPYLF